MGAGFSINTLKVKLRSAVERMKMQIGKHTNLIKVQRKEISTLLQTGKDETARIKVESMLALKNMVIALETLQLMCELLLTRVMLIAAEKQCPPDLVEGIASIVYCARRTEVPELAEIAEQFAMKYTVEWVKPHANNTTKKVSPRIIQCLSLSPPDIALIVAELKDIAAQYEVEWEPDLSLAANAEAGVSGTTAGDGSGNDGAAVNKLGAIAPIHAPPTPTAPVVSPSAAAPPAGQPDQKTQPQPPSQPAPLSMQPTMPGPQPPQLHPQPTMMVGGQPVYVVGDPSMVPGAVLVSPGHGGGMLGGGPPSTSTLPLPMQATPNPQPGAPFSMVSPAGPMMVDPQMLAMMGATPASSFGDGSGVRLRYAEHESISFPGTLNVLVHEGKNLRGNPQDPYVKLGIHGESNSLKTSINHGGGNNPQWQMEHCPFAVKGGGSKLVVEVYSSKSLLSDQLVGRCFIDVEYLVRHPDPHWYPLGREAAAKVAAGHLLLSSQYLPLNTGSAAAAGAPSQGGGSGGGQPIVVMEHGNIQAFTPIGGGSASGGQSSKSPSSAPQSKGKGNGGDFSSMSGGAVGGHVGGADGSLELNTIKPPAKAASAGGDEKAGLLAPAASARSGNDSNKSTGGAEPGSGAAAAANTTIGDLSEDPFAALTAGAGTASAAAPAPAASAAAADAEMEGSPNATVPKLNPPPNDSMSDDTSAAGAGASSADDEMEARLAALNK